MIEESVELAIGMRIPSGFHHMNHGTDEVARLGIVG